MSITKSITQQLVAIMEEADLSTISTTRDLDNYIVHITIEKKEEEE